MSNKHNQILSWMKENMPKHNYQDSFDLALDCASELDLYQYCEITGDKIKIPDEVMDLAQKFLPRN
jgi:hypothetical protein